jgi:hypothetical protein
VLRTTYRLFDVENPNPASDIVPDATNEKPEGEEGEKGVEENADKPDEDSVDDAAPITPEASESDSQ